MIFIVQRKYTAEAVYLYKAAGRFLALTDVGSGLHKYAACKKLATAIRHSEVRKSTGTLFCAPCR